jgi:hypothetical protein
MALQPAQGRAAYQIPQSVKKQDWAKKKRGGFKVKELISPKIRRLIMKKYKLL